MVGQRRSRRVPTKVQIYSEPPKQTKNVIKNLISKKKLEPKKLVPKKSKGSGFKERSWFHKRNQPLGRRLLNLFFERN